MKIVPSSVVCPRCNSRNFTIMGKDAMGYQKYLCKDCKRQFAPDYPSTKPGFITKKYPACPQMR
ncbi:MAG: transposase [Saccharofermentanales bacterium]